MVKKWGNRMAMRLPKALVEAAERSPTYRLADLVRGITERNRHDAVDTGEPRGREVW